MTSACEDLGSKFEMQMSDTPPNIAGAQGTYDTMVAQGCENTPWRRPREGDTIDDFRSGPVGPPPPPPPG